MECQRYGLVLREDQMLGLGVDSLFIWKCSPLSRPYPIPGFVAPLARGTICSRRSPGKVLSRLRLDGSVMPGWPVSPRQGSLAPEWA